MMRANVVFRPRAVSRNVRHAPRAAPAPALRWTSITSSPGLQRSTVQSRRVAGCPGSARRGVGVLVAHQWVTTTSTAVTSALRVASGSSTFQPKLISWS